MVGIWYRQSCFIINAQAAMESAQPTILFAAGCRLLGRGIGGSRFCFSDLRAPY